MASNLLSSIVLGIALLVLGASVGWIVGLSVSPVVSIVVSSVTALAATAVAGLQGAKADGATEGSHRRYLPLAVIPLAVYALGLAVGASVSMKERTGARFMADPSTEVKKWTSLGLDSTLVATRIFDARYPEGQPLNDGQLPFLHSDISKICDDLKRAYDSGDHGRLVGAVKTAPDPNIRELAGRCNDPEELRRVVELLCDW